MEYYTCSNDSPAFEPVGRPKWPAVLFWCAMPLSATPSKSRSIVYIDGFNFYYGVLTRSPYKWLNIEKFFVKLRQGDDVVKIRYFTAQVNGPKRRNQRAYLQALRTLPLVEIIEGRFKDKRQSCGVRACAWRGDRWFNSPEEKMTDVNIALWMLDDAYQNETDRLVLVSGDSDLVPAIELIKKRFPEKKTHVYVPAIHETRGAANEIRNACHTNKTLPLELLKHCQFQNPLQDIQGNSIVKPDNW